MMQQRRMIQASGPLVRKDFMLHDRANWPTINPPPGIAGRNPSGQVPPSHRRGNSVNFVPGEATLEEEEDVSRGDTLDFMTPREISRMRYERHHEWMEEILESHYPTKKIMPSDLGLGRKGELEALTSGFFDAPTTVYLEANTDSTPTQVGTMAAGKAEDFAKLAAAKIADMQAELERMKHKHARRMERLRKTSTLSTAEKRLRNASFANEDQGRRSMSHGTTNGNAISQNTADAIIDEIEGALGRKIELITNVNLVEKGGLDERPMGSTAFNSVTPRNVISPTKNVFPQTISSQQNGTAQHVASLNLQQQRQQLLPSQGSQIAQGTTSTSPSVQANEPESTSAGLADATATSGKEHSLIQEDASRPVQEMDMDVQMAGLENPDETQVDMEDNAWVMVDEDGDGNIETSSHISRNPSQPHQIIQQNSADAFGTTPGSGEHSETLAGTGQTPLDAEPMGDASGLETGEFDLSGDFDDVDVDTAGDALNDYGSGEDDLNLDTMDDSAFADAFHAREDENTPMDDNEIS
jgi:Fungal domain of unknown function (DUF1750)